MSMARSISVVSFSQGAEEQRTESCIWFDWIGLVVKLWGRFFVHILIKNLLFPILAAVPVHPILRAGTNSLLGYSILESQIITS